ncbi:enhanced disease susceptibility 1 [Datura stramonium]|uniref:Enhanced disease susceptibility 1 n=1 Tax=Datura stramonium TaxID=4076 RepID=A0ABS8WQU6_DATST|nr:enhanced disease susceptibility 1 [Datura stramonium]
MVRIGEVKSKDELIKKACNLAMEAHNLSSGKPYIYKKKSGSNMDAVFGFAGTWSLDGWYSSTSFGETKINITLFPSLRSVGTDEVAMVNEAFARRFEEILNNSSFKNEVEKAMRWKQIVFAGHSSGGPIAILAALWCLEYCRTRPNDNLVYPYCMTFGSPLVGDRIWSHALRRENWARYFIHFVMKLCCVLNLKGCTNLLLETVSNIVQLSPYRPFATYVFCNGNGKLVVVENPDAVLQLLFYSSQMNSEAEAAVVVARSLNEHVI